MVDSLKLSCEKCSKERSVSKKIKVVYKEGVGRHVIATEDIDVGGSSVPGQLSQNFHAIDGVLGSSQQ